MTPEKKGAELAALAEQQGLTAAAVAHDPNNIKNISLSNVIQVYLVKSSGAVKRIGRENLLSSIRSELEAGQHRISKDGIDDPRVLDLWWTIERGNTEAVPALVKAAKKNDQAAILLATIQARYQARADELAEQSASIETYEAVEAWLLAHKGLDTKSLAQQLKTLQRDRSLRDELTARSAYQKCMELIASDRQKQQEAGRAGLAQLAQRFPDTVYGQKAAR